jgi:EAL domain-containing protein (putative c-di-GMP-specific phosphodiesterase class I)/FixJ family two-component response regulator
MTVAAGMDVLVVEDHDFQRRTVARMLRSLGARDVLEASNGKQALDLLAADGSEVALVVCDLNMPEMDGLEFIRRLGESQRPVSVIIQSAQDRSLLHSVDKMTRAYGVRLLGVIAKPVSLEMLRELIARHNMQKPAAVASKPASSFTLDEILAGVQAGEFEPFFQPKVELQSGRTVGAEALARWRHPEKGLIAPFAFIPLLEENRLVDGLTFLMLEKAAAACHSWRGRGFDLTVSVNLSLVSLSDTQLAERITKAVASSGLEARHMVLEITETTAMTEVAPALENLARLRMRGFGLSVDDYGTGFSSLRQLTRVPFSELKIDQSFVMGCSANPSARTIVHSSVEMAGRLGIKTVAEGVETRADWDVLKEVGCNLAQGYLIAKPMEDKSFLDFCSAQITGPFP